MRLAQFKREYNATFDNMNPIDLLHDLSGLGLIRPTRWLLINRWIREEVYCTRFYYAVSIHWFYFHEMRRGGKWRHLKMFKWMIITLFTGRQWGNGRGPRVKK